MAGERNSRGVNDALVHGCCHQGCVGFLSAERYTLPQQIQDIGRVRRVRVPVSDRCRCRYIEYLDYSGDLRGNVVRTGDRAHGDVQAKIVDSLGNQTRIGEYQKPRRESSYGQHGADIRAYTRRLTGA